MAVMRSMISTVCDTCAKASVIAEHSEQRCPLRDHRCLLTIESVKSHERGRPPWVVRNQRRKTGPDPLLVIRPPGIGHEQSHQVGSLDLDRQEFGRPPARWCHVEFHVWRHANPEVDAQHLHHHPAVELEEHRKVDGRGSPDPDPTPSLAAPQECIDHGTCHEEQRKPGGDRSQEWVLDPQQPPARPIAQHQASQ